MIQNLQAHLLSVVLSVLEQTHWPLLVMQLMMLAAELILKSTKPFCLAIYLNMHAN